jgi:16S rRNA processing protein RimM
MKVEWRRGTAEHPLLKLEGVHGRSGAEALRGAEIHVPRAAVAVPAGEFLVDDLLGCSVVDGPDPVGTVADVLLLPAADVLEVARPAGAPLLVPLVADAVRSVDVDRRRIDIDLGFVGDLAD